MNKYTKKRTVQIEGGSETLELYDEGEGKWVSYMDAAFKEPDDWDIQGIKDVSKEDPSEKKFTKEGILG